MPCLVKHQDFWVVDITILMLHSLRKIAFSTSFRHFKVTKLFICRWFLCGERCSGEGPSETQGPTIWHCTLSLLPLFCSFERRETAQVLLCTTKNWLRKNGRIHSKTQTKENLTWSVKYCIRHWKILTKKCNSHPHQWYSQYQTKVYCDNVNNMYKDWQTAGRMVHYRWWK